MTLSRNLAVSASKISADGDIDYNNLINKPTIPSVTGLASETYVDTAITNLVGAAPAALDTLKEIADRLATDESATAAIVTTLGNKANTSSLATVATSGSYADLSNKPAIQAPLVSGTNIKTINGTSILGSGDLTISGGGGGGGTTTNKLTTGVGLAAGANGGLVTTLYESTRTTNNNFGSAIATTDQYIVVGEEAKSSNVGIVYVYSATTNALLYTLTNPLGTASKFGSSVDIYGNYIAVGAPLATGTNSNAGKVYYYDISTFTAYSGTPITVASANYVIADPNAYSTDSGDNFGTKVKITNNYLVATAPAEVTYSGYVYIFNRADGTLLYTLSNPNPYSSGSYDYFGADIAIYGNTLVVGAYGEEATDGTNASGRAYVYNINTFPVSPATIASPNLYGYTLDNPSTNKSSDQFGNAVAVNGNYVAVGVANDSPQIQYIPGTGNATTWSYLGTVYVFNKTTGALVYQLNPEPLNNYIGFGYSLGMNDTQLLVGTYYNSSSSEVAYLYDLSTGKLAKIFANPIKENLTESDSFGKWVALSNNKAVISAQTDNKSGIGNNLGAVHVFNPVSSFDGSSPLTQLSLETTAVLPSQYGMVSGSIVYVPKITVDKYGRVVKADQDTYYAPAAGLTSAYTSIVGSSGSPLGASGSDSIKFVGTGATTVTVADVGGIKTVTIDTVASSGSGSTTVTTNISQWNWDGMSNQIVIQFTSTSDVTTFLAHVGSNAVTFKGFSGSMYMNPTTGFTVTGTWSQAGSTMVMVQNPTVSPSIPGSADSGMNGTAAYTYTSGGSSASTPASNFSAVSSSNTSFSAPLPSGADGTKSVLMWVIAGAPGNQAMGVMGTAAMWNPVNPSQPISPSFSSLYTANSVSGTPSVSIMNPGYTSNALQWVLTEPLGMSSVYNGTSSWNNNYGTIQLTFDPGSIPGTNMVTTRKAIYAMISTYGSAQAALSGFTSTNTDVVYYYDTTNQLLFLKIAAAAWTNAAMTYMPINLGSFTGTGSGANISGTFFCIGS